MTNKDLVKFHHDIREMVNEVQQSLSQFYDEKDRLLNNRSDLTENALCEEAIHFEERLDRIEKEIAEIKEGIS